MERAKLKARRQKAKMFERERMRVQEQEIEAGRKIARFIEKHRKDSSTPEIFYADICALDATMSSEFSRYLLNSIRPSQYEKLGNVLDYQVPSANKVRLVRDESGLRTFLFVSEDGVVLPAHPDFSDLVGWAVRGYLAALSEDSKVEMLLDEEINHLLSAFQNPVYLRGILKYHKKFRMLTPSVRSKTCVAKAVKPHEFRMMALGGSTRGIVGSPGDRWRFSDYPQVQDWFRDVVEKEFDVSYDWRLNPRRRRRRVGEVRPRWVFRVITGMSVTMRDIVLENIIVPSADVVPSMHWQYVAAKAISVFPTRVLGAPNSSTSKRIFAISDYTGRGGHAMVGVMWKEKLLVLDPHGKFTSRPLLVESLSAEMPFCKVIGVSVDRSLRIQYAYEGSCGVSSVSLIMGAARFLANHQGQHCLDCQSIATGIFKNVSDLDVVVASQLVHLVA